MAAVGGASVAASVTTIVSVPATLTSIVALTAVGRATSTSLAAATAATWSGGLATVAGVSEREVGVITLRAGPVVVVERASLGSAVVSTAPVVASALAVVEAPVSTTVVSESAVVSATTVAALPATAGPRFFAAVADGAAGKVGIVAFRAGPIVVSRLASAALAVVKLSISASVVSVPAVVPSALTVVESSISASVVSVPAVVPSALAVVEALVPTSVVSVPAVVPAVLAVVAAVLASILSLLSGLFLGSNGHRDADQGVHVKRAVDVSHVSEGSVGAADDAVHLTDVGPVVGPDHDGVEGRRRAVKMHEQATFVASRFNRARKHPKTCLTLRPSAFGVVGITRACVAEATGQRRAWRAWPRRRGTAAHRSRRQPAVVPLRGVPRKQGWECSRRVGCWHRIRPRR